MCYYDPFRPTGPYPYGDHTIIYPITTTTVTSNTDSKDIKIAKLEEEVAFLRRVIEKLLNTK